MRLFEKNHPETARRGKIKPWPGIYFGSERESPFLPANVNISDTCEFVSEGDRSRDGNTAGSSERQVEKYASQFSSGIRDVDSRRDFRSSFPITELLDLETSRARKKTLEIR